MEIKLVENKETKEMESIIFVEFADIYAKKNLKKTKMCKYQFKEFTVEEFSKMEIMVPKAGEEGTAATGINPMIYMINAMITKGEPLTEKTRMWKLNTLKKELKAFL